MNASILIHLKEINDLYEKYKLEHEWLLVAIEKFPDLNFFSYRFGKTKYSSASVNELCTDVEIYHTCGCCDDASLKAHPYIIFNNQKIYSSPADFYIGEKSSYYYCDIPSEKWKNILIDNKISNNIIEKIQKYFDEEEIKKLDAEKEYEEEDMKK